MESLGKLLVAKSCSKVAPRFICSICDYFTDKKSSHDKHLLTSKHKILQNPISLPTSNANLKIHACECGKQYKHAPTLYAHKKTCPFINKHAEPIEEQEPTDK